MPQTCSRLSILPACCNLSTSYSTTNLPISSSGNKSVKIRLVATCHLQTCYNFLKQLAASLWITSFDNQLAISLLTARNRLVVNKLPQARRMHPDIGSLVTNLLQDVNRLVVACAFFSCVSLYHFFSVTIRRHFSFLL